MVLVPSPEQEQENLKVMQGIRDHEQALPNSRDLDTLQSAWESTALASLPDAPRDGLLAHYEVEGSWADSSGQYQHGRLVNGDPAFSAGIVGRAADFDGETQVDFGNTGGFERTEPVSLAFWLRPSGGQEMTVVQKLDSEGRGWEVYLEKSDVLPRLRRGSRLYLRLIHQWPDNAIQVRTHEPVVIGDWRAIAITYDGSGRAAGVKIYVDGKSQALDTVSDALRGSIRNAASLTLGDGRLSKPYRGSFDDFRIYSRALPPAIGYPSAGARDGGNPGRAALKVPNAGSPQLLSDLRRGAGHSRDIPRAGSAPGRKG
jgi:hypothetical protein